MCALGLLRFSLDEMLELTKNLTASSAKTIGVYPETKRPEFSRELGLPLETALVHTLAKHGFLTDSLRSHSPPVVILQSFSEDSLLRLRNLTDAPRMQLLQNPREARDAAAHGAQVPTIDPRGLAKIAQYSTGVAVHKDYLLDPQLVATTQVLQRSRDLGMELAVYTLNDNVTEYEGRHAEGGGSRNTVQ